MSESQARKEVRWMVKHGARGGVGIHAYRCSMGDHWHIGHGLGRVKR
jgi:hypothetical protein